MFVFPTHLFNPSVVKPDVIGRVVSGGVALSGVEDAVATDGGGRIRIDYSGIVLRDPTKLRLWNAWNAHLKSGVVACLVPLVSIATAPRPWAHGGPRPVFDIGGDDPTFPTEVKYRVRTIAAVTVGAAALRATTLTIEMTSGSPILGGEWFGIPGQSRGHRIERVTARSGMQATVIVEPPFRAAVADGTVIEFEWPLVKSTLIIGTDIGQAIQLNRRSEQSISFVEAA